MLQFEDSQSTIRSLLYIICIASLFIFVKYTVLLQSSLVSSAPNLQDNGQFLTTSFSGPSGAASSIFGHNGESYSWSYNFVNLRYFG